MARFTNAVSEAGEAHASLRYLASSTGAITDPARVSGLLPSLTQALGSLIDVLHQLDDFHDDPTILDAASSLHPARDRAAASFQASWELHRAAEMLHQVIETLDQARKLAAPTSAALDAASGSKSAPGAIPTASRSSR